MIPELQQQHQALGIDAEYGSDPYRPRFAEATALVNAGTDVFDRNVLLQAQSLAAWQAMQLSAKQQSIHLYLVSGFRSYRYQADLIQKKINQGQNLIDILKVVAAPGFSEHHTGRAIDITSTDCEPLQEIFETTPAFRWLREHAADFGFKMSYPRDNPYGFIYEPWHWSYHAI